MIRRTLPKLNLLVLMWVLVSCMSAATPPSTSAPPLAAPVAQATALPTPISVPSTAVPTVIASFPKGDLPTPALVVPTATQVPAPPTPTLVVPTVVPSPTQVAIVVVEGRTPTGDHFLGDANAQQTLIEYSDFL
jgi:hypothetical protein